MTRRYYLDLYGMYFKLALKTLVQYRADFGITAASAILREGSTLLFLSTIFGTVTKLQDWGFYDIVLVYGLVTSADYLATTFLDMPHSLGGYVRSGRFDVLLIRPPRPLFQMIGERCLNPTQTASFIVGVTVVATALGRIGQPFQWWWLLYVPLVIISGSLLFFSITLIVACLAFRLTSVANLLHPLGYVTEFARYPLGIYTRPVQLVLTWVLPYGMVGLYPAGFLLGKEDYQTYGLLAPLSGLIFLGLALLVWSVAVRYYQSTGT